MKRTMTRVSMALLALLSLTAMAALRDDYARQWGLTLARDDAGAYRVTLDRDVYRQVRSAQVTDLDVVNADGIAVPTALFAAEQPLARAPRTLQLPWFALPPHVGNTTQDITLISERNADGSVRAITTRVADAGNPDSVPGGWLVDASRLREPVRALTLDWTGVETLDTGVRVEGSDDLRRWIVLNARAPLVDLSQGGSRLRKDRITIDVRTRYLRLSPLQPDPRLHITSVRAELAPPTVTQDWRWEQVTGQRITAKDGAVAYVYRVDGRFPFERADLVSQGNSTGRWTLSSRDNDEAPWRRAANDWMAYRIQGADAIRSPPQPLRGVLRDRQWRLQPASGDPGAPPILRLGYRPEVVVFLAQGKPPYALLAGSARAVRADAPLPQLVDALRTRRGKDWQPAPAYLGDAAILAGDAALVPAPVQHDWKAWLLWAVLVLGALLVAGFAISLLRRVPNQPGAWKLDIPRRIVARARQSSTKTAMSATA